MDAGAASGGTGFSWECAFQNLQDAINAAGSGHEIWVKAGTYKPSSYPTGCTGCSDARDYAFLVKSGVKVYGGFAGTESAIGDRNIAANPTILSGDLSGNDVFDVNNDGYQSGTGDDNCHHTVILISTGTIQPSVFDGFSVTGGNANGTGNITVSSTSIGRNSAAGMYASNSSSSSLTITNSSFYNNGANLNAGGFYSLNFGSSTISNNAFSNNCAIGSLGGGLNITNYATQTISSNAIYNNKASVSGGGIYN